MREKEREADCAREKKNKLVIYAEFFFIFFSVKTRKEERHHRGR